MHTEIPLSQLHQEHATLSFLVWSQYKAVTGRKINLEYSLADGYFFVDSTGKEIEQTEIDKVQSEINSILSGDNLIELKSYPIEFLQDYFTKEGHLDKVKVLATWNTEMVPCIEVNGIIDYCLEKHSTNIERLKIHEIIKYEKGLLLRFPTIVTQKVINKLPEYIDAQHRNMRELKEWSREHNCEALSDLNEAVYSRKINHIKHLCESVHERKIFEIAAGLVSGFPTRRVVTIAGPSSSNKTTFAKRLAAALEALGYGSTVIEMDNFYKDLKDIPVDEHGFQDWEHIGCIDTGLLTSRIRTLIEGGSVPERVFSHVKKVPEDSSKMLKLPARSFLVVEGIHGLNPLILDSVGRDRVAPIYISAMCPVSIDSNHRFPTADLRLVRRMTRDFRYRGTDPADNVRRWPSVREGEERYIFPHQANALFFFNSALPYELNVLACQGGADARAASEQISREENKRGEWDEARRIARLLSLFYPLSDSTPPGISCIREFIGGSELKY